MSRIHYVGGGLITLQDAQKSVSVFDGKYDELQKKQDTLHKEDSKLRSEKVWMHVVSNANVYMYIHVNVHPEQSVISQ